MSSLSFLGNSTSYLRIPNTNDFDFGTGDFTIEWYQYQRDSNAYPRIFQVGSYGVGSGISIGVSIEGGSFYYWRNGSFSLAKTLLSSEYKNVWVHFAISRSSGVTKIFMNGNSIYSMVDTNNFNGSNDLNIGNESTPSNNAAFGGYITYFTWVKGVALYTSNFTVSNNYPTLTSDYVLLLKASSFDGTLGNTVVNNNVSTTPNVPPNFLNNNNSTTAIIRTNMRSFFSDNSMVYYKSNSLPSCGVGSVRNSSVKRRRT
jgi:hypothetical protein